MPVKPITAIGLGVFVACTLACKSQRSASDLRELDCGASTMSSLKQQLDQLVAQHDQSDFLSTYLDDAAMARDPASLRRNLDAFANTIASCPRGAHLAEATALQPTCGLQIVARSVLDQVAYGLQKVKFAPFYDTLKFKRLDGEGHLFIKRRAASLVTDPRQDYVIEGYHNAYHWSFRKGAGDLHPGFLLADELGKNPWSFDDAVLGDRLQVPAEQQAARALFNKYQKLVQMLEEKAYLKGDLPKGAVKKDTEFNYLRIVQASRAGAIGSDASVRSWLAATFGEDKVEEVMARLKRLFAERSNPPISKREITAKALQALNIDVPYVTLVSENGHFYVQLLDHHRIYGAQGLAMSIEVHHMWGIQSFN